MFGYSIVKDTALLFNCVARPPFRRTMHIFAFYIFAFSSLLFNYGDAFFIILTKHKAELKARCGAVALWLRKILKVECNDERELRVGE